MDLYCYVYIYIYIYIYIYVLWRVAIFLSLPGVTVALYLTMLELSALTPPIVDYLLGTGLMEMLLWTVGSFYVFGNTWDSTLFLQLRFHFFEKTQISTFNVYLHRSIMHKLGKVFF